MKDQPKYAFKGVWISKEIWLSEEITWMEKCLLADIDALDDGTDRACYASNEYFAEKFRSSPASIANQISKLRKLGFVETVGFDGRERSLRLTDGFKQVKPASEGRVNQGVNAPIGEEKAEGNSPVAPKGAGRVKNEPSIKSKLPTTEPAIRISGIFHRKLTTEWTPKEITAFKKLPRPLDLEELGLIEEYYATHWPPTAGINILRHDVLTFLNNYCGEIDRARTWKENPKRENIKKTANNHSNGSSGRNEGTFNAGRSSQYAGVEKLA